MHQVYMCHSKYIKLKTLIKTALMMEEDFTSKTGEE